MWGMALLSIVVLYSVPLIYVQNKEFIDSHLEHAGKVASQQASQVRDLASQHAGKSFETVKSYTGEYASKAGDMVGTARQKIPIPTKAKSGVKEGDFPKAPKTDLPSDTIKTEPEPVPAY
jgi:hypothetical protein